MFSNCQLMGTDMAFPDVCMTPAAPSPIPVPYPNIAMGPMAIPNCPTVLIMGGPVHNMATTIPMTNGDNAGVLLGVASGTVMGPSRHTTGSTTVLYHGMPATRLTSTTMQNSTNAMGARIAPSQTLVLILAP
ncbi:protein of unknown function [Variovorax sp. PDC80]|jgi:Domain of unknown function (DUF4150)|uniref:DUF4150 domain-containing protein n=1 Tax=Variovorax TaxID=34072 RepID=UPI0008E1FB9C|nr:DUF4150 domain-containing protein [Variovorax sp. PDC80]QRF61241.1 DUF4150 domain-containing protein [Variovorax paradoxus]SFO89844.1 protein of unknown function [Variovorax sp. PDC80]